MKTSIFLRASLLAAALGSALAASALPVTFTATGVGSGTFNGTPFTNVAVTLTGVSDTSLVVNPNSFFYTPLLTNTVAIAGFVPDTLTGGAFAASQSGMAGFGVGTSAGGPSVLGATSAALAAYDLRSSVGPVSGTPFVTFGTAFTTVRGTFVLNSVTGNVTFTAQVVPEPAPLAVLGLPALAFLHRRKRA